MIIAVDFDGTIVEHQYPKIGNEIPFAIETLKKLQEDQHRLILWSVREGHLLEEAIEFCRERGLEFYAANKDFPEEHGKGKGYSRKLKADLFIDDRNLGGLPDWGVVYQMIKNGSYRCGGFENAMESNTNSKRTGKKKNIFTRIGEVLDRNGDY
ncbi:BT0820 family HAD-type phosphatase [uncultured Bacteroides sp.]|uniref:BT0820 family HAD-type phosphatase n=1 Tax=uncultured Bacteroides sp. TaxID=162156 RepID=UPI002AAAE90C|nr:hypothetical protein [uncultured Bacteroides sp.]